MDDARPRDVVWIASSLRDMREFPAGVRQVMGFALYEAQMGGKHPHATPLKGFKGGGVLEVIEDHDGDTYRTVYTVRFAQAVYVLHAFQKKSKHGIATPRHDMNLIRARLDMALRLHESRGVDQKGRPR